MTAADSAHPAPTATADSDPRAKNVRPAPAPRSGYRRFVPLATRRTDNDPYGHLNNVVYLSRFESVVNAELVAAGVLDIANGEVIGLVSAWSSRPAATSSLRWRSRRRSKPALRSRGSGARASPMRSASSPPAPPRPQRTAASSMSTSIKTRRPVPLPDRLLAFVKALQ